MALRLLAAGLFLAGATAPPAAAVPGVAGTLRLAIDRGTDYSDFTQTAKRSRVVILQRYQTRLMRELHAANPRIRVLVYQDLAAMTYRDEWGMASTGVSTQEADQQREWYLLNTSGQAFTFRSYSWLWAADIGQPGYQRRWADNVSAILREGWDGVFVDDANPTIRDHYDPAAVARYPDDSTYAEAMRSALAYIGPRIRATGKRVIANLGNWRDYSAVVNPWLSYLDGAMDERFAKLGGGPGEGYVWDWGAGGWQTQLANLRYVESLGKLFLGVARSDNGDRAAARYGWGTTLLGAGGHSLFALHGDYASETWFPEYDYPIGEPRGPASSDPSGIRRRVFTTGLVLVNPTAASQWADFGRAYDGSGLRGARSAWIGPHSALVLYERGAAPPRKKPCRKRVSRRRRAMHRHRRATRRMHRRCARRGWRGRRCQRHLRVYHPCSKRLQPRRSSLPTPSRLAAGRP